MTFFSVIQAFPHFFLYLLKVSVFLICIIVYGKVYTYVFHTYFLFLPINQFISILNSEILFPSSRVPERKGNIGRIIRSYLKQPSDGWSLSLSLTLFFSSWVIPSNLFERLGYTDFFKILKKIGLFFFPPNILDKSHI